MLRGAKYRQGRLSIFGFEVLLTEPTQQVDDGAANVGIIFDCQAGIRFPSKQACSRQK